MIDPQSRDTLTDDAGRVAEWLPTVPDPLHIRPH